MTGYEQSPDDGGPDQSWKGTAFLLLLVALISGAFVFGLFRGW